MVYPSQMVTTASTDFWLLASAPPKISVCQKNNGFTRLRGAAAPSPLACTRYALNRLRSIRLVLFCR